MSDKHWIRNCTAEKLLDSHPQCFHTELALVLEPVLFRVFGTFVLSYKSLCISTGFEQTHCDQGYIINAGRFAVCNNFWNLSHPRNSHWKTCCLLDPVENTDVNMDTRVNWVTFHTCLWQRMFMRAATNNYLNYQLIFVGFFYYT